MLSSFTVNVFQYSFSIIFRAPVFIRGVFLCLSVGFQLDIDVVSVEDMYMALQSLFPHGPVATWVRGIFFRTGVLCYQTLM